MGLLTNEDATPDLVAIKNAADVLEIKLPKSEDPKKLVPALRKGFAARLKGIPKEDWIVCEECGEVTDDAEDLDACPFCGDDGLEDEDESAEAIDGADLDPEDDNAPEEPPAVDLDDDDEGGEDSPGDDEDAEEDLDTDTPVEEEKAAKPAEKPEKPKKGTAKKKGTTKKSTKAKKTDDVPAEIVEAGDPGAMAASLEHEKHLIKKAQTNMVGSSYELGSSLYRIHQGELWKAEGHKTFRKFLETVGVSSTLAYDLMGLVEKFDRETFMEVGRKRLLIVAKADKSEQPKLLDKAKSGATRRELEAEAKGDQSPPAKETPTATPEKEDQISLLAKVGGRPKSYRFTDRKTKKALKTWEPESYVEIQISEDVTQLLGLKTDDDGKVIGVTVAFLKIEAEKPAKSTGKKNGKAESATA